MFLHRYTFTDAISDELVEELLDEGLIHFVVNDAGLEIELTEDGNPEFRYDPAKANTRRHFRRLFWLYCGISCFVVVFIFLFILKYK